MRSSIVRALSTSSAVSAQIPTFGIAGNYRKLRWGRKSIFHKTSHTFTVVFAFFYFWVLFASFFQLFLSRRSPPRRCLQEERQRRCRHRHCQPQWSSQVRKNFRLFELCFHREKDQNERCQRCCRPAQDEPIGCQPFGSFGRKPPTQSCTGNRHRLQIVMIKNRNGIESRMNKIAKSNKI